MSNHKPDDKAAGIAYMILGVAGLAWMDALGKRVVAGYSVFEMLAIRSTVAVVLVLGVLALTGNLVALRTRQPARHALRALCGLISFTTFYAALRHMPLADAVAVSFGSPFLVTAVGRILLKEPVGPRRWMAIAVGFLGMLLIVRPTGAGFEPAALLILVSGMAYALMMVMARWMTRPERPPEHLVLRVLPCWPGDGRGLAGGPGVWKTPDTRALAEMTAMAVFGTRQLRPGLAFRAAWRRWRPSEYTGLIWAVIFGAVLFGEVPVPTFWIGAAVIIGAGLYTVRAEVG